jgi:hypothetical protein
VNQLAQYAEPRQRQNEDEVSLVDIIRFFRLNWKFLGLITIALSSVAIALSLSRPQLYQKQLVLAIKPLPLTLASQSMTTMNVDEAGARAVTILQNQKLDQLTTTATYDAVTQQVDLTLDSPNQSALAGASSKVISQLNTQFEKQLAKYVKTGLTSTTLELKRYQQILAQLDRQVDQLPVKGTTDPEGIRLEARRRAMESERGRFVTLIATRTVDKEYLEQVLKNPAQLSGQVISVQVLSEADVQKTRSPMQLVILSIIASFIVAVLAAIIREQIPRLKYELSKEKVNESTDV